MMLAGALLSVLATLFPQSPQVAAAAPPGAQRGTDVTLVLRGQRLGEPLDLMLERPGIELRGVTAETAERCRADLHIQPDCPLGAHPLRLRTSRGISNLWLFQVGALPELQESPSPEDVRLLPLDTTINGQLGAEAADVFTVELAAGAAVRCEVVAMRLGRSAVDLALTVHAPDGTLVAESDDTPLGHKDPMLAFTAAAAGPYRVTVTPAFADGANSGAYRLSVGSFPRPTGALPCGGQPGEQLTVALLGDGAATQASVRLPDDGREFFAWFPEDERGAPPSPILLRVGGPPNGEPTRDDQGRDWVEFPGSVHGVVATPEQGVRFHFRARKGEELEFRAWARMLRSPLDPVLILRQADGRFLAYNDDGAGRDAVLRFTPPADGAYTIEVRDLLRGGSPEHFFRLEGAPRGTAASLRMVVNQQEQPVVAVPRGGHAGGVLQVGGLDAGTELSAFDLPEGVTASIGPVLRGQNQLPFLLAAADTAPLQGAMLDFAARGGPAGEALDPGYAQPVPLVLGRNNIPMLGTVLRRLPVAVTEAAPFALTLAPPTVPVVRGAPLGVKVRLQRAEGFRENVRLRALWTPPGVTAGQVVVPGDRTEAVLPLDASAGAVLGPFPLAVIGSIARQGGVLESASAFAALEVGEPWITAEVGLARCAAGRPATLTVQLRPRRALEQPGRALLLGLPKGVVADAVEFAPDAPQVSFALQVPAGAAVGRHRNLTVELRVPSAGGDVVHRFGGGELRIDPAAPADGGGGGGPTGGGS